MNLQGGHELSVVPQVREEFEARYLQLHKRLTSLRAESEEVWKTLETAESSLMDMISAKDYDVSMLFAASGDDDGGKLPFLSLSKAEAPKSEAVLAKLRADRQETEDFYLSVMSADIWHAHWLTDPWEISGRRSLMVEHFQWNISSGTFPVEHFQRIWNMDQRNEKKWIVICRNSAST